MGRQFLCKDLVWAETTLMRTSLDLREAILLGRVCCRRSQGVALMPGTWGHNPNRGAKSAPWECMRPQESALSVL